MDVLLNEEQFNQTESGRKFYPIYCLWARYID